MTPASDHDALERNDVDFEPRLEQTSGQWRRLAPTVLIFPSLYHITQDSRTEPCGKCRRILCLGKYFRATEAFVVNFPRTCHKHEGQKLVVETARDTNIVFERRHEVVALHEQLGRRDVENPSSIANETGRTVRLKSS